MSAYLTRAQEGLFPNLNRSEYEKKSEATEEYNCFAWAANVNDKRWEPQSRWYWPPGCTQYGLTLPSAICAFGSQGFQECESADFEDGYEKVAIYLKDGIQISHAARQKPNGHWTSKLGDWEDIEHHNLHALEGFFYGQVAAILRRAVEEHH